MSDNHPEGVRTLDGYDVEQLKELFSKVKDRLNYETVEFTQNRFYLEAEFKRNQEVLFCAKQITNSHTTGTSQFQVSVNYPTDHKGLKTGYEVYYSINIDLRKSAETIAREIGRRLLPKYLQTLDQVCAAVSRSKTEDERRTEALTSVAQLLGLEILTAGYENHFVPVWKANLGLHKYEYMSEGIVELRLKLPTAKALEVVNLLKAFQADNSQNSQTESLAHSAGGITHEGKTTEI